MVVIACHKRDDITDNQSIYKFKIRRVKILEFIYNQMLYAKKTGWIKNTSYHSINALANNFACFLFGKSGKRATRVKGTSAARLSS